MKTDLKSFIKIFLKFKAISLVFEKESKKIIDVNNESLEYFGLDKKTFTSKKIDDIFKKPLNFKTKTIFSCIQINHKLENDEIHDINLIVHEIGPLIFLVVEDANFPQKKKIDDRFNIFQKIAKMGSWSWDFETDKIEWSQEMFKIMELVPFKDKPSYKLALDAVHPKDRTIYEQKLKLSVENNQRYNIYNRLITREGKIKYVHSLGEVTFDDKGKSIGMIGTVQDITENSLSDRTNKDLYQKVLTISKKKQLTNLEKNAFYGIISNPLLNDRQISNLINIKRSTIGSIRNRLAMDGFYSRVIVPNYPLLGCEILCIIKGGIRNIDFSEKIYSIQTDTESINILVSSNYTNLKIITDIIPYNVEVQILNFPFALYEFKSFFDFGEIFSNALNTKLPFKNQFENKSKKITLTKDEKIILYAITKYPNLSDFDLSKIINISRQKIGKVRFNLLSKGAYKVTYMPHFNKFDFEIMSFIHRKDCKNIKNSFLNIIGPKDSFSIIIHKDLYDYKKEVNRETINIINESLYSTKSIINIKPTFGQILKKMFSLNVDF